MNILLRSLCRISKREFHKKARIYGASRVEQMREYTVAEIRQYAWQDGYHAARADLRSLLNTAAVESLLTPEEMEKFKEFLQKIG